MASSTTHVIEIETGIGEPAFIPLTLGQELQPISVGKKGMWRIESPRVLDVHAFVYFDGNSLFLQSADEESAASVDGFRVGKAWTELHAPCKIDIGGARLRFRSLSGGASASPPPDTSDQAATMAMAGPPVQGVPGGGPPPKPAPAPDPITLPKNERPFRPGEFAAPLDDDSTRVAPLESTGANRVQLGPSAAPLPAAGRPIEEDDLRTRADVPNRPRVASGPMAPPGATGPFPVMGVQPVQSLGPVPVPVGSYPPGTMPVAMGSQPQLVANMQSGAYPPAGYPVAGNSGAFAAMPGGVPMGSMPPGAMGPVGPMGTMPPGQMPMGSIPPGQMPMGSMPPGQMPMGAMGPGPMQQPQKPASPLDDYVARYKELSGPKKILVFVAPLCLLSAFYVLLVDDEPPPQRPRAQADAGVVVEGGVAVNAPTAPAVSTQGSSSATAAPPSSVPSPTPVAASCPPGFEPYPGFVPQPGGVIPCIPVGSITQADAGAAAATGPKDKDPTPTPTPAAPPPPPVAPGQKTLERQAVDHVAAGEYGKALAVYEQLRAQHPNNAAYAEAVRILRAKAAGTAP